VIRRWFHRAAQVPVLRGAMDRATDALAPAVAPDGVCVLCIDPDEPPAAGLLRRIAVGLESASVRSPSMLDLMSSQVWPADQPTAVFCMTRPTVQLVEGTLEVLEELGWGGVVFLSSTSPHLARVPEWIGRGLLPGLLWTGSGRGVAAPELREQAKRMQAACGRAPSWVLFGAEVEAEWAARAAAECGLVGFGPAAGLASVRTSNELQPTLRLHAATIPAEVVAWATRDRQALAMVELSRFVGHMTRGSR